MKDVSKTPMSVALAKYQESYSAHIGVFRSSKFEEALGKFETVLGLKPEAREAAVASYNVACCYSKLDQVGPR